MSGIPLQYSTHGIENGSLSTPFHPNDTSYPNCTSIECFGQYLLIIFKKKNE